MSDQAAKLEELSLMIRDLPPAAPTMAPWIPEPPLAFGQPGMTFMPVPAFTGVFRGPNALSVTNALLYIVM